MKHCIFLFAGLAIALSLTTCTKDKAPNPSLSVLPAGYCDTAANTYNKNIKKILDDHCATSGCHNATSKLRGYDFSTYLTSKARIAEAICNIKDENGCLVMPPYPERKLDDSLITRIEQWTKTGYCE